MKSHRFALLMLGAVVAACTNKEIVEPQQGEAEKVIHFTATLAPKGEGSSRAITSDTDENGKEILNVNWAEGEEIAIRYQKNDGSYATATATVGTPNADRSASFTATLTDAKDGGEAKFVYPATLHNGTGGIDENKLLTTQNGKLTADNNKKCISKNFDAATGMGRISVTGETATINGNIGMKNEVCICKMFFSIPNSIGGTQDFTNFTKVKIYIGDKTYSISHTQFNSNSIYVAMLPCEHDDASFEVSTGTQGSGSTSGTTYRHVSPDVTLTAGKFYRDLSITVSEYAIRRITEGTGEVTLRNGQILTGTGGSGTSVTIADGATITLRDVNMNTGGSSPIKCAGDATIILEGTNRVGNWNQSPGIQASPSNTTLTISGSGSLTATGGSYAAGIGSGYCGKLGDITISGGNIVATGGTQAAGIGCGSGGKCGRITISGGNITATGGSGAAGIGCGREAHCGGINITGGCTITAYKGEGAPYSIGKGSESSYSCYCGEITIGGRTFYGGGNFLNGGEEYLARSPFVYP